MTWPLVFISASIPAQTWAGPFDPLEITDAVVAVADAVLAYEGTIVTAAHPTIAPLILQVIHQSPGRSSPSLQLFQSRLFEDRIPRATAALMDPSVAEAHWTPAEPEGDPEDRSTWGPSLLAMRRRMFSQPIDLAVFIGGMEGIRDEYDLLGELRPDTPRVPFLGPGGAAASLRPVHYRGDRELLTLRSYPFVARQILNSLG